MKAAKTLCVPAIVLVLTCAGCATSYHSSGFTGGFSDTQLAPDLFRVTFRGNGYTPPDRSQDLALLRAADLTMEKGYSQFAIVDESNSTRTQTFTTAGHARTTGTATIYGSNATYSSYTTYKPGQTFTFYKPSTGLLVQCFKEKPDGVFTFDAAFLQQSLRQKYKIK
jgi:hypothetical protein